MASSTEVSPELERNCFEIERAPVADHLDILRRTIKDGAYEMEMVAAEKMFYRVLSESFSSTAQSLRSLVQELTRLRKRVVRATGYPKRRRKRIDGK